MKYKYTRIDYTGFDGEIAFHDGYIFWDDERKGFVVPVGFKELVSHILENEIHPELRPMEHRTFHELKPRT